MSSKTDRPAAASTGSSRSTPSTVRMNQNPSGIRRASGPRTSRKNPMRCVASSSVALTCSFAAPERDRRVAGRAQIADPVDLAPGRPDPTPTRDLDDRHGCGAKHAARPAANRDEPVETQRNAGGQGGTWRSGRRAGRTREGAGSERRRHCGFDQSCAALLHPASICRAAVGRASACAAWRTPGSRSAASTPKAKVTTTATWNTRSGTVFGPRPRKAR